MRTIIGVFIGLFVVSIFPVIGQAAPNVSANNAVLIEQSTGRVLYEKDAYEQASIASITKIMTALIAIESGKMDEKAKTSRKAIYTEGSSIYLEQGEKMKLEDLVYGLMLRSGNDAAVAIAEHVGESEEGFVFLMNEKAKWLGMNNTNFENPHGLDSDNHYSSAYDMALLMQYAMKNEKFRTITGANSFRSENRSYSWVNKNRLLTQLYEPTNGGKTGFTKKTGRTLVSSASKDGMDLIVVTLNAPDDWRDHINLYEWGFEHYQLETLSKEGNVTYKLGNSEEVNAFVAEEIKYPLTQDELKELKKKTYLLDQRKDMDIIGKTVFELGDGQLAETPIHRGKQEDIVFTVLDTYKKIAGMSKW
ncbi:D-alanyl-D-alanine carboxypeptidase family protein [Oceanobacillus chungangensis]|uniref:D-alanyl-D-alanine carboxypeptidase n=1 Tax=Oceanobacillus chungangensis TaxID=1229152 RepID=A0A3D8Q0N1_9BACI|nr:D-alanyl-D-alanine carboxypeptidase family protein [Oceanobacillus chungangensis]RDW22010.1 D-alanyl-D-alanine carboxypeptidase [Oceanobacillus chungangensis]